MFETLTERLGAVFDRLRRRGALSEADVDAGLREIRVALLEADVALPVVKDLVAAVRTRALGQEVVRSVTPGQMVVKIVHDHLIDVLGREDAPLVLGGVPSVVLMVGLQGSGKTTTAAKLAYRLRTRDRKKVLLASLDVYRPAAQDQTATLAAQAEVAALPAILGEQPLAIANRALATARREGVDVVILDTAGRTHIDQPMMDEAARVKAAANPAEVLLVVDALTGQDALAIAKTFDEKIGVSGIVLTRADGDARGGAALSMRAATGRPIKFLGVGEKLDALEAFQAARIADRILGQGDIVGLVERASQVVEREDAEQMAAKMMRGEFTLDDLASQLGQLRKMGDLGGLLGMLPGVGKIKRQLADAKVDERQIARQEAIVRSMTRAERRNPKLLNGSRRRRIAAGSGTSVPEVNRLLKQHQQMSAMMKTMGKLGPKGMGRGLLPPGLIPGRN